MSRRSSETRSPTAEEGLLSSSTEPATAPFSTGIPSLDDILGGLPPSCSLVVTAPDLHTDYGDLVQKYSVAQALASHQRVCVVGNAAWVHGCMWISASAAKDADETRSGGEKIKIAWRYEEMKQFQTTVSTSSHPLDLSVRIPPSVVSDAISSQLLTILPIDAPAKTLDTLQHILSADDSPFRICIPSFGSPYWGDLSAQDILRFLHRLRALLRRYPHACASTNLVAEHSADVDGWHQKLGWVSDGAITLSAFAGNKSILSAFWCLLMLVRIHSLPAPRSLVPTSDRFSALRGASSGGGENNLGFKCTRKRLIFETLHLDVEGGVSERRTTAPAVSTATVAPVKIEVEGAPAPSQPDPEPAPKKKTRKKVGFQSDRPELYDF
ncbi:hypothetical protein MKEN_00773900 [Mycena kentingensis (nom. inval.)]|nr:hypothetical protein MKEN_00773900 [Mycena kentingensis (nom. inval.)]